jgi:hypothetical protein
VSFFDSTHLSPIVHFASVGLGSFRLHPFASLSAIPLTASCARESHPYRRDAIAKPNLFASHEPGLDCVSLQTTVNPIARARFTVFDRSIDLDSHESIRSFVAFVVATSLSEFQRT